jgi:hypothetical protein
MCELLPILYISSDAGLSCSHKSGGWSSRVRECHYFISSPGSCLKQIHHMSVKSGILACWCLLSFCPLVEIQCIYNHFPKIREIWAQPKQVSHELSRLCWNMSSLVCVLCSEDRWLSEVVSIEQQVFVCSIFAKYICHRKNVTKVF